MQTAVFEALQHYVDPARQAFLPKFFKTGKGEYAEGDVFLGVTVPQARTVAKAFSRLSLDVIAELLESPYHEVRLVALLVLTTQFEKGDVAVKKKIVSFYLSHLKGVNNWDLVDLSAYKILGAWLLDKDRAPLFTLAKSTNLWKQRIAMVATYAFIRNGDFGETFLIAQMMLTHPHDLMHKATGWMLREVGKRDPDALRGFLTKNVQQMPRTALRYAIEKFPESERKRWLVA